MIVAPRLPCYVCRRPQGECYCALLRPFASWPRFCILMHPEETRRAIATGRMTHLCLSNSLLYSGLAFDDHDGVRQLLDDADYAPVLLYPAANADDLDTMGPDRRRELFPPAKRPLVFVLDGTWRTVKHILRASPRLARLPCVRVTPRRPSEFLVRRQPRLDCLATIEAVHAALDRLGPPDPMSRHDNMLEVFQHMVRRQLEHRRRARAALYSKCIPVPALYGLESVRQ